MYEQRDYPMLLKALVSDKTLEMPLQVNIPDTCIFSGGGPRFLTHMMYVQNLRLIEIVRKPGKLRLTEIRKFFQEGPAASGINNSVEFLSAINAVKNCTMETEKRLSTLPSQKDHPGPPVPYHQPYRICYANGDTEFVSPRELGLYMMRQKVDSIWKEINFIQRTIFSDRYKESDTIRIKFDLSKAQSTHLGHHFFKRADIWVQTLRGKITASLNSYIRPEDEERFINQVQSSSPKAACRYLTTRIFHYMRQVKNKILSKFVLIWHQSEKGELWLVDCIVYSSNIDEHQKMKNESLMKQKRALNPYMRFIDEKMRTSYLKRATFMARKHYEITRIKSREMKVKLPKTFDDTFLSIPEILKEVYERPIQRVKELLELGEDQETPNRIRSIFNESIEQQFPSLTLVVGGEVFQKKKELFEMFNWSQPRESLRNSFYTKVVREKSNRSYRFQIRTEIVEPRQISRLKEAKLTNIENFLKNKSEKGVWTRFNKSFHARSESYSETTTKIPPETTFKYVQSNQENLRSSNPTFLSGKSFYAKKPNGRGLSSPFQNFSLKSQTHEKEAELDNMKTDKNDNKLLVKSTSGGYFEGNLHLSIEMNNQREPVNEMNRNKSMKKGYLDQFSLPHILNTNSELIRIL